MFVPRFRLFAGPNGSGKTFVFNRFKKRKIIHTDIYVNADLIEKRLRAKRSFFFTAYGVVVSEEDFRNHIHGSTLFQSKIKDESFVNNFSIRSGKLSLEKDIVVNSYHASFIATFLALKLFETKQSFAYETVMSHPSKIELLNRAKAKGYKTYLYFVFADDLQTNLARVQLRAQQGGHNVPKEVALRRAPKSFKLLPEAFAISDSAYVIDNSSEARIAFKKENAVLYQSSSLPGIIGDEIREIIDNSPLLPLVSL